MRKQDDNNELPTISMPELDKVSGGAGTDMMSMMLPMLMMKNRNQAAAAAPPPPPQPPKLMVDGQAQQLQSDGQGGYIVNADESADLG
jgi:hypothetical protein